MMNAFVKQASKKLPSTKAFSPKFKISYEKYQKN